MEAFFNLPVPEPLSPYQPPQNPGASQLPRKKKETFGAEVTAGRAVLSETELAALRL